MSHQRNWNLDFLRAMAIIAVLFYHVGGMWPNKHAGISAVAPLGKYGVTLFFVLSGWLIGGIYWRELEKKERVRLWEFWFRRWARTLPPYFVGIALGYLAVRIGRAEPFDVTYLFFGQNYQHKIPYYLISWSLCVEEHFYLVLPLLGVLIGRMKIGVASLLLWALPSLPLVFRFLDPGANPNAAFGYAHTATHLVYEGLAIGVAAAHTRYFLPRHWLLVQRVSRALALPMLVVFVSILWWSDEAIYYFGQTLIAWCCFTWLAAIVEMKPLIGFFQRPIYLISISSYSTYLTHSLAIHLAKRVASPRGGSLVELAALGCWILIIAGCSLGFYLLIEKPSIQFRDYLGLALFRSKPDRLSSGDSTKSSAKVDSA